MAFTDPVQWIIIGVILIVIFLWGPQKIPELARALGRARKEFDNASKEVTGMATTPAQSEAKSGDETLMETAKQLGISTEGKTRDKISAEIVEKAKSRP